MSFAGSRVARITVFGLVAAGCVWASPANANGEAAVSLHRFSFTRHADDNLNFSSRWRVTICTSHGARLRIRAVVEPVDLGRREVHRFVRRQPAGCKRHLLRKAGAADWEGSAESRLRVAWRDQHRRTRWLSAQDPAPD